MFELYTGASYLFQWDLNQKLIVHDDRVVKVHFSNSVLDKAIVRECYQFEGKLVCDIPNKLLETSGRAYVYPFAELDVVTCTLQRGALTILEKKKPNDYVEDDDDVYQWTELEKRIRELEKGNIDLSNYYTKEEADGKFITEHQNLSEYAKKTDIPTDYAEKDHTHSQYLTQHQDLSSYAKKTELPTKTSQLTNDSGYITSVPQEVAVQNNQPTSSTLWIDTDSTDEINLAEIDDNTVSDEKTWSSTKISREIVNHENNTTTHVTSAEKQVWNNKVDASQLPTITQEAGDSETLIMSQKAVTQLVNDALGTDETEYEKVDSVAQMTDVTKQYLLSTTGTLWAYTEVTTEPQNRFDPSKATLNTRHGTSSTSAYNGLFVTDYIKLENITTKPYIMRAFKSDGVGFDMSIGNQRIHYFDTNKTLLGNKYLHHTLATNASPIHNDTNGNAYWHINEQYETNGESSICDIVDFDFSKVVYVRVTLAINNTQTPISSSDIANVIIKFDADIGTKKEWVDTKITPENAKTNYVDLLVKVNQNTSDIKTLEQQVANISSGSENLTIPTFWENAVNEVITKIKALQVGRNSVTFAFFSDNHQRLGYVGQLIAYVMKECNMPYAFFGGDSIDSDYIASEQIMINQDKAFDRIMSYIEKRKFKRGVGNHDGYWAVSSTEKYTYTREQVYELFLREEAVDQNMIFGDDGTYYYVEDLASKVRFIVMNTNGSVDSTQLSWLQNTALSFNESGWGVVFISHQPISNHYHALISNAQEVINIVKNYINGTSTNKADVIGWFSGHIHRDRIYSGIATNTSDDSEGTAMGFKQVTITSDHTSIAYDDSTKHAVANDDKSHAIDFVTINKSTRQVNITRLGIGNDRSYTY